MKLEKREITLNELDSLKDVYYFEKTLLREYETAAKKAERKEAQNEIARFLEEVKGETESAKKRIEKHEL